MRRQNRVDVATQRVEAQQRAQANAIPGTSQAADAARLLPEEQGFLDYANAQLTSKYAELDALLVTASADMGAITLAYRTANASQSAGILARITKIGTAGTDPRYLNHRMEETLGILAYAGA